MDLFESIFQGIERRERTVFTAAIHDIGKVILLIKKQADEWLVYSEKIGLCDFSASAHNAAAYSVYWEHPILNDYFEVSEAMLRPAISILGYTLSDYLFMKDIEKNEISDVLFIASIVSLLGEEKPDVEKLRAVSPELLVNDKTPPMFLWATSADALVPVGPHYRGGCRFGKSEYSF